MSRQSDVAYAGPILSPWGTDALHGQDEASGSSSVAGQDASHRSVRVAMTHSQQVWWRPKTYRNARQSS